MNTFSTLTDAEFEAIAAVGSDDVAGALSAWLEAAFFPSIQYVCLAGVVFVVGWSLFRRFGNAAG